MAQQQRKKLAKHLASWLTVLLALGSGLIGAVAILLLFPTLSLPLLVTLFCVFTLTGGLTESLVYHQYTKKFARYLLNNSFFESIEQRTLKEHYAQQDHQKYYHQLTAAEKKAIKTKIKNLSASQIQPILSQYQTSIRLKKISIVTVALPIASVTAFGFTAFAFSNVGSMLALFGIASGAILLATPWTIAIPLGILYAVVMFMMLHNAIKNNIFVQIKNEIVELFSHANWRNLNIQQKAAHIAWCALKAIGVTLVLGIAVAATILTAGAWLNKSVIFIQFALGAPSIIANKISWLIGSVMTITDLGFSVENSLETMKAFTNFSLAPLKEGWKNFKTETAQAITHPKTLPSALLKLAKNTLRIGINGGAFIVHIAGMGAVATMGAPTINSLSKGWQKFTQIMLGVFTGSVAEALQDSHALFESEDAHGHGHSHDVASIIGKTVSSWGKMLCFFKKNPGTSNSSVTNDAENSSVSHRSSSHHADEPLATAATKSPFLRASCQQNH